jgi:hypothetical protein
MPLIIRSQQCEVYNKNAKHSTTCVQQLTLPLIEISIQKWTRCIENNE